MFSVTHRHSILLPGPATTIERQTKRQLLDLHYRGIADLEIALRCRPLASRGQLKLYLTLPRIHILRATYKLHEYRWNTIQATATMNRRTTLRKYHARVASAEAKPVWLALSVARSAEPNGNE
jgi:hypothetical protein